MSGAASIAYRALVLAAHHRDARGWRGRVWRRAYSRAARIWGDHEVRLRLHGQPAILNFGNPYPFFVRQFSSYNAPQVEAVAVAHEALRRRVTVVDVGAAVGDTALLLLARCAPLLEQLICVEGEAGFAELLRRNVGERAIVHEAVLSDRSGVGQALVRAQHAGTAIAIGGKTPTTTLDELLGPIQVDLLKIDTDGYDGRVLGGSCRTLRDSRPLVLFEWHPLACAAACTDALQAFRVLEAAAYNRFVFFDKFGEFSHFQVGLDEDELGLLERLCRTGEFLADWHYDVLALPEMSVVDPVRAADRRFWMRQTERAR